MIKRFAVLPNLAMVARRREEEPQDGEVKRQGEETDLVHGERAAATSLPVALHGGDVSEARSRADDGLQSVGNIFLSPSTQLPRRAQVV